MNCHCGGRAIATVVKTRSFRASTNPPTEPSIAGLLSIAANGPRLNAGVDREIEIVAPIGGGVVAAACASVMFATSTVAARTTTAAISSMARRTAATRALESGNSRLLLVTEIAPPQRADIRGLETVPLRLRVLTASTGGFNIDVRISK
jgi:hypothetical protein